MDKRDFDDIDKFAKDTFENFEVDFNPKDWFDFEDKLDQEFGIDKVAKEKLEHYSVPYNEADWNDLEAEMERRKQVLSFFSKIKIAEAGILALFVFTFLQFNLNKKSNYSTIASNKTINDKNSTLLNSNALTANHRSDQAVNSTYNYASDKQGGNQTVKERAAGIAVGTSGTKTNASRVASATDKINTAQANTGAFKQAQGKKRSANDNVENTVVLTSQEGNNGGDNTSTTVSNQGGTVNNANTSTPVPTEEDVVITKDYLSATKLIAAIDAADNKLESKIEDPIIELKNIENPQKYICKVHLGGFVSTDVNLATSMGSTSVGYSAGLFADIECSARLFVRTGFSAAHQKYFAERAYILDKTLVDGNVYNIAEAKTTNLAVVKMPVDVHYIFFKNKKWRIYASAGLVANLISGRIYEGQQALTYNGAEISSDINASSLEKGAFQNGGVGNNFYLSIGGGVGLERQLGDRLSIYLMPSYRHAIVPIGNAKDYINTFSLQVGLKTSLR